MTRILILRINYEGKKVLTMFFNKHKEVSKKLAAFAIAYCEKQLEDLSNLQSEQPLSDLEIKRLPFCLYILNVTIVICWINVHERNKDKAIKIIDSTVESFIEAFKRPIQTGDPLNWTRIGDFIIDPKEIALIGMQMPGGGGATADTRTDYAGLLSLTYNIRAQQYSDALRDTLEAVYSKKMLVHSPLLALFMKHLIGEERWNEEKFNDVALFSHLGLELTKWVLLFSRLVKETL